MSPGGAELSRPATTAPAAGIAASGMLVPLVLAQFLCSFAATTMNIEIERFANR
jgi:hypothetical protein